MGMDTRGTAFQLLYQKFFHIAKMRDLELNSFLFHNNNLPLNLYKSLFQNQVEEIMLTHNFYNIQIRRALSVMQESPTVI